MSNVLFGSSPPSESHWYQSLPITSYDMTCGPKSSYCKTTVFERCGRKVCALCREQFSVAKDERIISKPNVRDGFIPTEIELRRRGFARLRMLVFRGVEVQDFASLSGSRIDRPQVLAA